MRIYCIHLKDGSSSKESGTFHDNMSSLKAVQHKHGPMSGALVSHHLDPITVWMAVSYGMKNRDDVTVEEITKTSLEKKHEGYKQLVKLIMSDTKGSYPNIE